MKKLFILVCSLLFGGSILMADNSVIILKKSGQKEIVKLSEKPKIVFDDLNLYLNSPSFSKQMARTDVQKIYIAEEAPNSVESIVTDNRTVVWNFTSSDNISCEGLTSNEPVCVYNLKGEMLTKQNADVNGNINISINSLGSGVYLIKSSNSTFKFIKK